MTTPYNILIRSLSERKPNPSLTSRDRATDMCPYSSVNQEFFDCQRPTLNSDRYSKLDPPSYSPFEEQEQQTSGHNHSSCHSHSMTNLSSFSSESPTNHKEWIAQIKQDLEQFSATEMGYSETHPPGHSKDTGHSKTHPPSGTEHSITSTPAGNNGDKSIPKISTRWSQFMCEEDSDSEEEENSPLSSGPLQGSPDQSVHILASKSTISRFTLVQNL